MWNSCNVDWIGLSSVLRPLQHSIGYMGDGFYRSKDPTNSINSTEGRVATSAQSQNSVIPQYCRVPVHDTHLDALYFPVHPLKYQSASAATGYEGKVLHDCSYQ